jgi:hypothetical protein
MDINLSECLLKISVKFDYVKRSFFGLCSSGFFRRVVLAVYTDVSEKYVVSIFSVDPEDGGSVLLRNIGFDTQTFTALLPKIYYYYLFKLQMGFYPVSVYYNKTQHTNNTQHTKLHKK